MAWRNAPVNKIREDFITDCCKRDVPFSDLCQLYDVSRKTGYKWLKRYEKEGLEGLKDRSRAPHSQPLKMSESAKHKILKIKEAYPYWGPKKLAAELIRTLGKNSPSAASIGRLLDAEGLTKPRKRRRRYPAKTDPLAHAQEPNDVWGIDFKGWFITRDNIKYEPFTITDAYSRYLLRCIKLPSNDGSEVWKMLEEVFYQYGLPRYIRHDNGPPFATSGAGRLSRVSVKLIKAGVIPEWIDPGKPYQNGRHERMHLTLKKESIYPAKLTLKEQEMSFKKFVEYYNTIRPHESLNQQPPGSIYVPSSRSWNGKLKNPEYGEDCLVKKVTSGGQVSWRGKEIYIGKTLSKEYVALKENEDGDWEVYYGPVHLGAIGPEMTLKIPQVQTRSKSSYKEKVY